MSARRRVARQQGADTAAHRAGVRTTEAGNTLIEQDNEVNLVSIIFDTAFSFFDWTVLIIICFRVHFGCDRPIDEPGDGSNSTEYGHKTKQYQHDVSAYLQLQKEHVMASVRASERLIQATLQSQYHLFKPKYLLLQEGNKANSRAILASAMVIFSRVKMNNLLALAFGTWKILLVQMASLARRPLYARVASCYLMSRWQQEVHLKKLRIWIVRWRRRAGALIFIQRSMSVVRIQTMYRTWRDRRKFIAMHLSKTFQGVLSDIFLDRKRPELIFFIPDIIRNDRRLLWKAATFIQTLFR